MASCFKVIAEPKRDWVVQKTPYTGVIIKVRVYLRRNEGWSNTPPTDLTGISSPALPSLAPLQRGISNDNVHRGYAVADVAADPPSVLGFFWDFMMPARLVFNRKTDLERKGELERGAREGSLRSLVHKN